MPSAVVTEAVVEAKQDSGERLELKGIDSSPSMPAIPSKSSPLVSEPFPPSKTDKPRPHVCTTCTRAFARLEHLKRHERSHTKEKPFECQECTRCFARRDLLLRHQQKLHMSTTPAARPRSGRRESTSSSVAGGPGRVRKNSMANGPGSMRPRANTISHVDGSQLGLMLALGSNAPPDAVDSSPEHQPSTNGFHRFSGFPSERPGPHGMHSSRPHGLTRIETRGLPPDMSGNLRTAPPFQHFPPGCDFPPGLLSQGTTVNPAQLHLMDSPVPFAAADASPFPHGLSLDPGLLDDDAAAAFDWMDGLHHHPSLLEAHEHAIAGSSPSAGSSGSPDEGPHAAPPPDAPPPTSMHPWAPSLPPLQAPMMAEYSMDIALPSFAPRGAPPPHFSPEAMDLANEPHFPPPHTTSEAFADPATGPLLGVAPPAPFGYAIHPPLVLHGPQHAAAPDTPTTGGSVRSSQRQSSVTSISTDSLTDATRSGLMAGLAAPGAGPGNGRKWS